jgi:hypothetical protein
VALVLAGLLLGSPAQASVPLVAGVCKLVYDGLLDRLLAA